MPNNDLLLMTLFLLAFLLLVVLFCLLSVVIRGAKSTTTLLQTLLIAEQNRNQSLLNQLRSGDPMTLHALQSATQGSTSDEEYTPSYDEGVTYAEKLANSNYGTQDLDYDLAASGWEQPLIPESGGTPVVFKDA